MSFLVFKNIFKKYEKELIESRISSKSSPSEIGQNEGASPSTQGTVNNLFCQQSVINNTPMAVGNTPQTDAVRLLLFFQWGRNFLGLYFSV